MHNDMEHKNSQPQSQKEHLPESFRKVGSYMYQAMIERAQEMNDDEAVARLREMWETDDMPAPELLEVHEIFDPTSVDIIMERAAQIMQETHTQDRERLEPAKKPGIITKGKIALAAIPTIVVPTQKSAKRYQAYVKSLTE